MAVVSGWDVVSNSPDVSNVTLKPETLDGKSKVGLDARFADHAPVAVRVTQGSATGEIRFYIDPTITNASGADWDTFRVSLVSVNNEVAADSAANVHPVFAHFHDAALAGWSDPNVPPYTTIQGYNSWRDVTADGNINGADQLRAEGATLADGDTEAWTNLGIHQFPRSTGGGPAQGGDFYVILTPDYAPVSDRIMPVHHTVFEDLGNADTYAGTTRNDLAFGYGGDDTLQGDAGDDVLVGGAGNDELDGAAGNDWLFGGADDDVLTGGAGEDMLDGGAGRDEASYADETAAVEVTLDGSTYAVVQVGGTDTDYVRNIENVTGGSGNDSLTGDGLANALVGGDGNDELRGEGGNDTLDGGAGDDAVYGGGGNDRIEDTGGDNTLDGEGGNDIILGSGTLFGRNGNDNLSGWTSDDTLYGGNGNDTVYGGEGGRDFLYGENGNDRVIGWDNENTLDGGAGSDHLSGNGSNDILYGRAGNDRLEGGYASDTLYGHDGNDVMYGGDAVVDDRFGIDMADVMHGGNGNDVMHGQRGNDTMNGDAGNDLMNGGTGNDVMNGGSGNDRLNGQQGNDVLRGRSGRDELSGGSGADRFDFDALSDSLRGFNRDVITDFRRSQGDRIDLSTIDANANQGGNQAFTFIGGAAFTAAGQARFANGVLQVETNGSGGADFEVRLIGVSSLFGSDLIV